MSSLYNITDELKQANTLYESMIDEETGEFINNTDVVDLLIDELLEALKNKSDNVIKFIKNIESDITTIKSEKDRLDKLLKQKNKKLTNLKQYILLCMQNIDTQKIETSMGNISVRKSTKTIIDENKIEKNPDYWRQEITNKFDKNKISKLIKSGVDIQGASLEQNYNIIIK